MLGFTFFFVTELVTSKNYSTATVDGKPHEVTIPPYVTWGVKEVLKSNFPAETGDKSSRLEQVAMLQAKMRHNIQLCLKMLVCGLFFAPEHEEFRVLESNAFY